MDRRTFCQTSSMGMLGIAMALPSSLTLANPEPSETVLNGMGSGEAPAGETEFGLWIQGSPYLGHSDQLGSLRGLSFEEARQQLVHFRTVDPWRRKQLFRL